MHGSTLVWVFVSVVVVTVIVPIIAGEVAIRTHSHYNQFWFMPVWIGFIVAWIWLANKISVDPTTAWFNGGPIDEYGSYTNEQWLPIVTALGILLCTGSFGGWIIPIGKYSTER
jgi:hypothetical protein